MTRALYLAGLAGPVLFLMAMLVGGAMWPGYSHLAESVSALGAADSPGAKVVAALWTLSGLAIAGLGGAMIRDPAGPGRLTGALILAAGLCSALIALAFPMDPPGVPMSGAMIGHLVLVAVSGLAYLSAMVLVARNGALRPGLRRAARIGIALMLGGGIGAMATGALGWPVTGLCERITQAGYLGVLILLAMAGLRRDWRA